MERLIVNVGIINLPRHWTRCRTKRDSVFECGVRTDRRYQQRISGDLILTVSMPLSSMPNDSSHLENQSAVSASTHNCLRDIYNYPIRVSVQYCTLPPADLTVDLRHHWVVSASHSVSPTDALWQWSGHISQSARLQGAGCTSSASLMRNGCIDH